MQKFKFLLFVPLFFISCNWEIPQKISIDSDAQYAFTVGDFSKKLSEFISIETITEKLSKDGNFTVYDYNPGQNCTTQEFLIDLPIKEITLDINENSFTEAEEYIVKVDIPLTKVSDVDFSWQADGSIDLGLSFNDLFSSFTDALGENNEFVENLYPTTMPVYIYCEKPELESFSNVKFKGSISLKAGKDSAEAINATNEIDAKQAEVLKTDENEVVITALSKDSASGYTDLAEIVKTKEAKEENIFVHYDVTLSGIKDEITLSKQEYQKLKEDLSSAQIRLFARIEIPLAIELKDAADNVTNIDILALADKSSDEDLFNRDEATDLEDFEKYIDIVEYGKVIYKINNELFSYKDKNIKGKMVFETNLLGMKNPTYEMSLSKGDISIYTDDVKNMLRSYPFSPTVQVSLPDGTLQIPRDAKFNVNLAVKIKTDGKVTVWEK